MEPRVIKKMYLESIAISEFCNRLSRTGIHSFNGILYVLQEFEVGFFPPSCDEKDICELRRNEIDSLHHERMSSAENTDYEAFLYEEYLW